jgi:hypothetical protein
MKKNVARGMLAAVVTAVFGMGLLAVVTTPAVAASCEVQCYQDYHRCVPFCSKNPCFVACETVLDICLSNCGSTE